MLTRILFVTILFFSVDIAAGFQAGKYDNSENTIELDVCLVSSINDIEVSARVKGYIESQPVKEGDFVDAGALIAQLDATAADNELKAAKIRLKNAERQAEDMTGIEYAKATRDVAAKELEINIDLNRKNALSNQELERSRLSKRQAELQIQRSESQLEIDKGAADLEKQNIVAVEEIIARHAVPAAFAGQIMKIYLRPGEWVHEGEKILRLVDLSQVKVEGHIKSSNADPDQLIGRPVQVMLKMAQDQIVTFTGQIQNIGLENNLNREYVVQAIVDNQKRNEQWLLRPNAVVSMTIQMSE